jgi:putative membrane protein
MPGRLRPAAAVKGVFIMKKLVLAAALLALALPAQAQNPPPANQNAAQSAASAVTQKFVTNAAITDMFEIQSGKLALEKSSNKEFQDYAQMTINDHTKTSEQLKGMAPKVGVQVPTGLDDAHQAKLDKLNSLSGTAFERRYKRDQVGGHKQAIKMFETYAKSGDNPDLKKWAEDTLPILKTHLQHAQALRPGTAPTVGSGARKQ